MKKLPVALALSVLLAAPAAMAKTVEAVASFTVLADIVKTLAANTSW